MDGQVAIALSVGVGDGVGGDEDGGKGVALTGEDCNWILTSTTFELNTTF